jgi:hypothetical protein
MQLIFKINGNRLQNESFRGKLRKFPTRSNPWAFPKWRFHNKSTYVYLIHILFENRKKGTIEVISWQFIS